ncbi:MAG: hypothetical protein ACRCWI_03440 [Brevinema sp.]
MQRLCEGVILSKRGFGAGNLILNFLDAEIGKITLTAYGVALETGKRRAGFVSGAFIEGLVKTHPKNPERFLLSDTRSILSIDNIWVQLKSMGFAFFTLEILDMMILENDLFEYYSDLLEAFRLFNENLDEKYVLFFLAKFLGYENWLYIPEQEKLHDSSKRFLLDALNNPMEFLQGKNISNPRRHELSYFFAHAVKRAKFRMPHSLELLRFGEL